MKLLPQQLVGSVEHSLAFLLMSTFLIMIFADFPLIFKCVPSLPHMYPTLSTHEGGMEQNASNLQLDKSNKNIQHLNAVNFLKTSLYMQVYYLTFCI